MRTMELDIREGIFSMEINDSLETITRGMPMKINFWGFENMKRTRKKKTGSLATVLELGMDGDGRSKRLLLFLLIVKPRVA